MSCDEILAYSGLLEVQFSPVNPGYSINEVHHYNRWRLAFWDQSQNDPPLAVSASSYQQSSAWSYIRSVLTRAEIWTIMDVALPIGGTHIVAQQNDLCSTAMTVHILKSSRIASGDGAPWTVAGCMPNPNGSSIVYSNLPPDSAWQLTNLTAVAPLAKYDLVGDISPTSDWAATNATNLGPARVVDPAGNQVYVNPLFQSSNLPYYSVGPNPGPDGGQAFTISMSQWTLSTLAPVSMSGFSDTLQAGPLVPQRWIFQGN